MPIDDNENKFSEENFTKYLCTTIKNALRDRSEFDKLVDRWYNDWRDIKDVKIWPWKNCANWSVPVTSTATDSVIPRVIDGNFDINPPIGVQAVNKTGYPFRDIVAGFMAWDLDAHPETYREAWFYVQNASWGGTSYMKTYMQMEKRTEERKLTAYMVKGQILEENGRPVPVTDQATAILGEQGIDFTIEQDVVWKKRKWHKYNPDSVVLDIKDVIFPSDSISLEDAWDNSMIAVRMWYTKDYLKRMLKQDEKELYKKLDITTIKELEDENQGIPDERDREEIAKIASKSKKLECFECYANYDIDGDGLEEKVVALIHYKSKTLCGYESYPYDHGECPIVPGYIKPIHNQPMGIGIPEMLFDTKGETDSTHNQRTDRGSLYNDPVLTYTDASGYDKKTCLRGPGRDWKLLDRGETAIGYLQPPLKGEIESFKTEALLLDYAQKRSGATEQVLGTPDARNQTKGGILALLQEGAVGFKNFTRWMSLSFAKIFNQRLALYQQYWANATDEEIKAWIQEILDIPGNPLAGQGIDAIRHKMNVFMTASKQDKNTEMQKASALYTVSLEHPLFQAFPEKAREALVDMFRTVGIKNPENKVPTLEEIKQWQVEIQKEAQMQVLQQVEQEKAQRNIEEAGQRGFQDEMSRLGATGGA